jgi:hypothetical protein
MSGYIFFKRTKVKEIDELLASIEDAGHAYHHTDYWNDEQEWRDGKTCIERIFEKAQIAANKIKELEK